MSKHTPVPYEILYGTNVVKGNRIVANCGGYSDNMNPNTLEDNKANAHFIVTACNAHADLLAACEAVVEAFWYEDEYDGNKVCDCAMCTAYRMAQAAIAKATSEDE